MINIEVARGKEFAQQTGQTSDEAPERSAEEDWAINVNAVKQYSKARAWEECLNALTYLSTRENNPEAPRAMAQRVWLSLKCATPIGDVTLALTALQALLGAKHELSGNLASLANLLCQHRDERDPELPLAQHHAQLMLQAAGEAAGIDTTEAFNAWVAEHGLDDPDTFIPPIMTMLELMVGDDGWWVDRDAVQEELMAYNADKAE
ncbi:hypothetical protein MAIT1_02335 [Magnetofaba australis IT-1]|uniref:Uncharacterized protein n=1 Tax=Magnetofaba australis IT-1 TaxID=1434232 RepID=A0A1Y2K2G9_9PROT|nr:hypothetical protein MAIT1_02335 [Magnetofaba australis IT-1]